MGEYDRCLQCPPDLTEDVEGVLVTWDGQDSRTSPDPMPAAVDDSGSGKPGWLSPPSPPRA
jgi:hypothetical protein